MTYLVDTNVASELRKRERGDANVVRWAATVDSERLYTSVLVIGEIRRGIELKRRSDPAQAAALDQWLEGVRAGFGPRVLPVDQRVAETWGRLGIPDPVPPVDGLIAATAIVHGLILVSRNVSHLARTGVAFIDPFSAEP